MGENVSVKTRSRSPVVNGLFYPEDPKALKAQIRSWGLKAEGSGGQAGIILAPHGAWELTGKIAGAAFAETAGLRPPAGWPEVNRVLLLGPVHQGGHKGLFLSDSAYFETPLGSLPVDKKLNKELASCSTLFEINDIPHLAEHSLEVLLPLVKYCYPSAAIVPILMGGSRPAFISGLAKALNLVLQKRMKKTLLVISTNLSANMDGEKARLEADEFIALLKNKNQEEFLAALKMGRVSACGAAILAGLLESDLLGKRTLKDGPTAAALGDKGDTVYYGALTFE
jgi:AmmeMemoRadiSam system protein B